LVGFYELLGFVDGRLVSDVCCVQLDQVEALGLGEGLLVVEVLSRGSPGPLSIVQGVNQPAEVFLKLLVRALLLVRFDLFEVLEDPLGLFHLDVEGLLLQVRVPKDDLILPH
jgi:hypothetical protein